MTSSELISICIPTYNNADYIKYTLNSVLNQTYTNLEIIISDDCSTDNTLEIIRNYSDPRIVIVTSDKNNGIEYNWNKTLKIAKGKYIKIIGADDILENECIAKQLAILEKRSDISLVTSNKTIINKKGKILFRMRFPGKAGEMNGPSVIRRCISKGTNIIGEPGVGLFRKEILETSGYFNGDNPYLIDLDLWSRILLLGNLYVIDEFLFKFRISKTSISGSLGWKQYKYFTLFAEKIYKSRKYGVTKLDLYQAKIRAFIKAIVRNIIFILQ